ncbi:MAG: DinB family protein [Acidobacteriaceae bacterium]
MSLAQVLFAEFEEQVPIARNYLERVPEDRLMWKPHEKSRTAGQLALHIATVPGNIVRMVQQNPAQAPDFSKMPQPSSLREVLTAFDESVKVVAQALPKFDDAVMRETFRIVQGGTELLAMPRGQFLRDIMLNHWYQHRGQLSVYLRLLNVAVPASWGPSADEPPRPQKPRPV